jgi:hypothetical protein
MKQLYRGLQSKLVKWVQILVLIGKEQADIQLAGALTGYSRKGKVFIQTDGTRATPEEVTKVLK